MTGKILTLRPKPPTEEEEPDYSIIISPEMEGKNIVGIEMETPLDSTPEWEEFIKMLGQFIDKVWQLEGEK